MKYTIEGFSQRKLVAYNLDIIDTIILRWYVDFLPKMITIDIDDKRYAWVKYQAIIDDLPVMRINNIRSIARRFDKFVTSGIMSKAVTEDARHLTCFMLTKKYLELVSDDHSMDAKVVACTQKYIGMDAKVQAPVLESTYNINKTHLLNSSTNTIIPQTPQGAPNLIVGESLGIPTDINLKIESSEESQEAAVKCWKSIIKDRKIEFTRFELEAVEYRARMFPRKQPHEINNEITIVDKLAWEGKDIENVLRSDYKSLVSVRPTLRVETDAAGKRIYEVDRLNAIRQNTIAKEKAGAA